MATQVQWRGGSTAEHATFTGAAREVTVDTQKKTLVVHDGSTAGGEPLLREDQANLPTSVTNGISVPSANNVALSTGGTGRLFVDSSGRVSVGSSALGNADADDLTVVGAGNTGITVRAGTTSASNIYFADGTTGDDAVRGYLAYNHNGDKLTIGTSASAALTVDSSQRLGVGTANPAYNLVVSNGGNSGIEFGPGYSGTANLIQHYNRTGGTYVDAVNDAAQHRFNISGTERLRITSDGNVGVGTSSPTALGTNVTTVEIQGSTTTRTGGIRLSSSDSSQKGAFYIYDGAAVLGTETSHPLGFYVGNTERARVTTSGQLLVGTSSARKQANIFVPVQTETTGSSPYGGFGAITNSDNAVGAYLILSKSRGTSVGSNTIVQANDVLGDIWFTGADGTDLASGAARIRAEVDGTPGANDMPGRLVFSTTSSGASSPTERLRLDSVGRTLIYQNTATTSSGVLYVKSDVGGTYNTNMLVYANGDVVNTNNSYGGISDIKLKENIVDASSQWDDLKALQVRNYNFKEGQTHTQIGLVAQEVELVSPGLVRESPDHDEDGNDLGTVTKSVNYSVLYMKAVKALQEAMERIETLEAKVAALESA